MGGVAHFTPPIGKESVLKKFLAVFLSVVVLGSVFVLGAAAEDVVREDDFIVFSRSVSEPRFILSVSGISVFRDWLYSEGYISTNKYVSQYPLYYVQRDNYSSNVLVDAIFASGITSGTYVVATFNGGDHNITSARSIGFDSSEFYDFLLSEVGLTYDQFVYGTGTVSVIGGALALGDSIFSVGSSLISFITSSWLTVVALVAFVLVLGFGVIRKLVKGV